MKTISLLIFLISLVLLSACSQRLGYEMFRQMGYQECLQNSPRPAEDCQYSPDFDKYQQQRNLRYPETREPQ